MVLQKTVMITLSLWKAHVIKVTEKIPILFVQKFKYILCPSEVFVEVGSYYRMSLYYVYYKSVRNYPPRTKTSNIRTIII